MADNSSEDSSSSSENDEKIMEKLKKIKKKIKKEQRRAERKLKKKLKKEKKKRNKTKKTKDKPPIEIETVIEKPEEVKVEEKPLNIPISLMERSKTMAPMSKEEWEKKQSVIRKIYDEESGRYRLIKGDGEVLEEIVPLKRHKEINQTATQADGAYFQAVLSNATR